VVAGWPTTDHPADPDNRTLVQVRAVMEPTGHDPRRTGMRSRPLPGTSTGAFRRLRAARVGSMSTAGARAVVARAVVACAVVGCAVATGACGASPDLPGSPTQRGAAAAPTAATPTPAAGSTGPAAAPGMAADAILGSWRRAGSTGTVGVVTFAGTGVSVTVPCATITGAWASAPATPSALLAVTLWFVNPSCPTLRPIDPHLTWLERASAFRRSGDTVTLLDSRGHPMAELEPAPSASTRPVGGMGSVGSPAAAVLPDGLPAATRTGLLGRWVPGASTRRGGGPGGGSGGGPAQPRWAPRKGREAAAVGRTPEQPFLELRADGSWTGSDGCNGLAGRWSIGGDGRLLALAAPTFAIGCNNVDLGSALVRAARVGFDGSSLILLDAAGLVTATLVRG